MCKTGQEEPLGARWTHWGGCTDTPGVCAAQGILLQGCTDSSGLSSGYTAVPRLASLQHILDSCRQTHQHSPAHSSRAAPAACTHQECPWDTALCPYRGDLAGLPCTVLCHDPHGTSSSLPWASSMAIWATGEILLEVITWCFKENELRTSFPQNTAALDYLPKAGKRRDYICLSVKAPVPLPAPWDLWYTHLGALSEWVREQTPHLYVKTEPVPCPDSSQS